MTDVKEREKSFELAFPVSHKGEDFTEITVKRPNMRALEKFDSASGKSFMGAMLQLVADCSGKPKALIEELDPTDFQPIGTWMGEIMGKSESE
jgi:hypothetical protein